MTSYEMKRTVARWEVKTPLPSPNAWIRFISKKRASCYAEGMSDAGLDCALVDRWRLSRFPWVPYLAGYFLSK